MGADETIPAARSRTRWWWRRGAAGGAPATPAAFRRTQESVERADELVSASLRVPLYRDLLASHGLVAAPSLTDMPTIDSAVVRRAGQRVVADGTDPAQLRVVRSGGTTGEPTAFYRDAGDGSRETRHVRAAWAPFGIRADDPVAVLVGRPVGDGPARDSHLNRRSATLWLGGSPLTDDVLRQHYVRIVEHAPRLLRGYPSALALLAGLMLRERLAPPPSLVATGSSSETLLPFHRDAIAAAFRLPHADLYGQTEHVALACSCPYGSGLHVDEAYGFVEIVDDAGRPVERAGTVGEVVATGLGNRDAPLIRYRTGDRASWAHGTCACGRTGPRFERVEGRLREQVLDHHGRHHFFGAAFYQPLLALPGVRAFQFSQPAAGVLAVDAVLEQGTVSVADVEQELTQVAGFDIRVRQVEQVRRTTTGKAPVLWLR